MKKMLAFLLVGCQAAQQAPTSSATPEATSLRSQTELVRRQSLTVRRQLHGSVSALEQGQVPLTSPTDATVTRVLVRVGDQVSAGQPVVEMNTIFGQSSLQVLSQLEQSQSALTDAQGDLVQARTQLAQAQTDLGGARSALSLARSALSQAEAEELAASRDDARKRAVLVRELFSKSDLDEARNRLSKARAVRLDGQRQVEIARVNVPLAMRRVQENQRAVAFNQRQVRLAEANYRRQSAVLLQSGLVGSETDPALSRSLLPVSGLAQPAARAAGFVVKAPISGAVTDLKATIGLKVSAGDALGTLTDISTVYVDARAYESDLPWLTHGTPLECFAPNDPGRTFSGRVHYLGKVVDEVTRTIELRARVDNPGGFLRPSQYVEVTITPPAREGIVVVPEKAILTKGEELYVLIDRGEQAPERRKVRIGAASQGLVEVVSGISPGERVITGGNLLIDQRGPRP
jgi:RND family efflux transporter MFP subunit